MYTEREREKIYIYIYQTLYSFKCLNTGEEPGRINCASRKWLCIFADCTFRVNHLSCVSIRDVLSNTEPVLWGKQQCSMEHILFSSLTAL